MQIPAPGLVKTRMLNSISKKPRPFKQTEKGMPSLFYQIAFMNAWPRKQNPSLCSCDSKTAQFKNTWHINAARLRNSMQHLRKILKISQFHVINRYSWSNSSMYHFPLKGESICCCQYSGLKSWIVFPAPFTLSPSVRSHKHKGLWVCSHKNSFGK